MAFPLKIFNFQFLTLMEKINLFFPKEKEKRDNSIGGNCLLGDSPVLTVYDFFFFFLNLGQPSPGTCRHLR